MIKITKELLDKIAVNGVGYTRRQANILKVDFPLKSGWRQTIYEKEITEEQFESLMRIKKNREIEIKEKKQFFAVNQIEKTKNKAKVKNVYRLSGDSYAIRNTILTELGFSSYEDYLQSYVWKQIKDRIYKIKGTNCLICWNIADVLRHHRYHASDLLGENLSFIVPLCESCHALIELDENGKKILDLFEVHKRYEALKVKYNAIRQIPDRPISTMV